MADDSDIRHDRRSDVPLPDASQPRTAATPGPAVGGLSAHPAEADGAAGVRDSLRPPVKARPRAPGPAPFRLPRPKELAVPADMPERPDGTVETGRRNGTDGPAMPTAMSARDDPRNAKLLAMIATLSIAARESAPGLGRPDNLALGRADAMDARALAISSYFAVDEGLMMRLRALRQGPDTFAVRLRREFGFRPNDRDCNALAALAPAAAWEARASHFQPVGTQRDAGVAAAREEAAYESRAAAAVAGGVPATILDFALQSLRFSAEIGLTPPGAAPGTSVGGLWADGAVRVLDDRLREAVAAAFLARMAAVAGEEINRAYRQARRGERLRAEEASLVADERDRRSAELAARPALLARVRRAREIGAIELTELITGSMDVRALLQAEPGRAACLVLTARERTLLDEMDARRERRRRSADARRHAPARGKSD